MLVSSKIVQRSKSKALVEILGTAYKKALQLKNALTGHVVCARHAVEELVAVDVLLAAVLLL